MDRVCKWAYERMLQQDFMVLDTESSSLDGEIIDLAIVNAAGTTIFDSLIKPVGQVSEAARRVHHISNAMLKGAPSFAQVWPHVWMMLAGKLVITYNADFDFRIMALSLLAHGLKDESYQAFTGSEERWHCLMNRYQEHSQKSRWQKLDAALAQQGLPVSNTHRALADAQAAYSLLKHLADKYEGSAYQARILARKRREVEQLAQASTRQDNEMERAQKLVPWLKDQTAHE